MKLTNKQEYALQLFLDNSTKFIGYGGAAGGGKSILGCYILILLCSELHGSKWFIGRDSLKDTRESVLFSFRKVSKLLGWKNWKYADNHIQFTNGSEIDFLDLSYYPQKDPLYERFGSKEYTGGWIEEAGSVHPLAFEVLKTRVNRWFNKEFGLIGKILITFNPKKGWLDSTFYKPYKKKEETIDTKFIPALYTDNEYLDEEYINNLKNIKDKSTRERLLHGNFDYEDDPTSLIDYEAISNIWTNSHISQEQKYYLVCDVARFGSDSAIVSIWKGLALIDYVSLPTCSTIDLQKIIFAYRVKYAIPTSRCLADEDGVGGGVVDNCEIIGFTNNSHPFDKGYFNLKCECGYLLAEKIKDIYIEADVSQETKDRIEEELSQLKTYEADKDGKLRILPKIKIKEVIGHSPDWLDVFIMRMYFELTKPEEQEFLYQKAMQLFN